MPDRDVWSKTLGISIPCDGPLDVQVARLKLEKLLSEANKESDVEWGFRKAPRRRARAATGHKRSTKLRHK
jgi:hypothetical protein